MSQKKQTRSAPAQKGKSSYKGTALWRGQGRGNKPGFMVLIAVIGIVAMLAAYVLDSASLLDSGETKAETAGAIRISEFMSQNVSALFNEGDVPDWIEIENVGSQPVNLHHYGLLLQSNINNIYSFIQTLVVGHFYSPEKVIARTMVEETIYRRSKENNMKVVAERKKNEEK